MLQLIEISLICTGIYVCFLEGMVFYKLRNYIEYSLPYILSINFIFVYIFMGILNKKETIKQTFCRFKWLSEIIIKPLYDCLPCMASFWTCVILWKIDIKSMLIVCGINTIIASVLQFFDSSKFPE